MRNVELPFLDVIKNITEGEVFESRFNTIEQCAGCIYIKSKEKGVTDICIDPGELFSKPYTFNEILQMDDPIVKIEHPLMDTITKEDKACDDMVLEDLWDEYDEGEAMALDCILLILSWAFNAEQIRKVLTEGKWLVFR